MTACAWDACWRPIDIVTIPNKRPPSILIEPVITDVRNETHIQEFIESGYALFILTRQVFTRTLCVSLSPKDLQELLDELAASRRSRKRAWENLQEMRWVLKDTAGIELPAPARKTIDLEGRIVLDGVRKTVKDRQVAVDELVKAIREFRKFTDQPLTLRGSDYAHAVQELNEPIYRAEGLLG
jgi:hypothetical protein